MSGCFFCLQRSNDLNQIAALLQQTPYHTDSLLTLFDLHRSMGEHAQVRVSVFGANPPLLLCSAGEGCITACNRVADVPGMMIGPYVVVSDLCCSTLPPPG